MAPRTPEAEFLIKELRKISAPAGTLIGGVAADYADTQIGIAKTMPWALTWIAIGVLILLFVFTGSIILPIKGTKLFVTIANEIVAPLLKYQFVSKSVYFPYKKGKIFKRLEF